MVSEVSLKRGPQLQDRELEGDHLRGFEQRAHRQHRELAGPRSLAIVCAGIDRDDVDELGEPALGCAVTSAVRAPAAARDAGERARGRRDRRDRRRR